MNVSTLQGLAVALIALLPGAAFTFAFERGRGATQQTTTDRVLRFLAASAVFHAVLSGPEYAVYRHEVHTHSLQHGNANLVLVEGLSLLYVALPIASGWFLGEASRTQDRTKLWRRVVTFIAGGNSEPRAWDELWGRRPYGLVRAKLKDGTWVGGYYGPVEGVPLRSYTAGFPARGSDVDILLTQSVLVDPDTGDWQLDEVGEAATGAGPVLLRWEEVQLLELELSGVDAPIVDRVETTSGDVPRT